MRVLSWNIRQGGGRRLNDIASAIASHAPDIVVINELRARTAPALREHLSAIGLTFDAQTNPTGSEYGILIASRTPLRELEPRGPATILRHGLLEVELSNQCIIGAIYGPMLSPTHAPFWDAVVAHAASNVNRSYLFVGDFNTGEAGVDAHLTRFAGSDQFCAIRSCGYVDLWRAVNSRTEHTWFSFGRGNVPLNGFRIDHALASPTLAKRLSACRYSHEERETRRLSDHSILLIDFASTAA